MHEHDIVIVATAMTSFGRREGSSVKSLTREVVDQILLEANLTPDLVTAAMFSNSTWGPLGKQLMIGGQVALRAAGVSGMPVFNLENACAGGASALHLAARYVASGASEVALALGVEQMNIGDKSATLRVFDGAYDVEHPETLEEELHRLGGSSPEAGDGPRSIFMDIYAATARAHMRDFGTTQEQIAAVASKNHAHAVHNEKAHYREPISVEDVLAARALAYPLTVPMCSPVTDGAAGAIVTTRSTAQRLGLRDDVTLLASSVVSGAPRDRGDHARHVMTRAAERSYATAGIGPEQIDVAEVHDATAFGEIIAAERTLLCQPGQGGPDAASGRTSLGGDLPINPSGGLESKGHPLSATGMAQVHELVGQLRGECGPRQVQGARLALAENGGGFHRGEEAVAAVSILGRSA